MKKRITAVFCIMSLMISMLLISEGNVQAASQETMIDGSYLTHETESVGYDTKVTRGVDLLTGYSKSSRLGPGKLYAGGTTIAAHVVDSVQVGVMVERAREGDTTWEYYDGWQKINHNTDRAGANRTLYVEGGYYYRVRCIHTANDDVSSSFTNGVYIE